MQVTDYDGSIERRILIGMITDKVIVNRLASKWDSEGLFSSEWANLIAKWCIRHYVKHAEAPGKGIESYFLLWARQKRANALQTAISDFLQSLSEEHDRHGNSEHLLDVAVVHLNKIKLTKLSEKISALITTGDVDGADLLAKSFRRIEMGNKSTVDVLHDHALLEQVLNPQSVEPLITYPGPLGGFFKESLARNALVAILAPEKKGKTWCMLDLAWQGMCARQRTAFFEIGDLTEDQIMRRFAIRAAQRPLRPKSYRVPVLMERRAEKSGGKKMHCDYEDRTTTEFLTAADAKSAMQRVCKKIVRSDESYLKLHTSPAGTMTVSGIKSAVEEWASDGWTADIIVIDYADLLRMDGKEEGREKINRAWQELRALSQTFHCLVITATQANRESYNAKNIEMKHSSEDKRKLSHVTAMFGLSQSDIEKSRQIMRYNWVVMREDEFRSDRPVYVAQCLAEGRPVVLSSF
jgi:hypothetical protein